MGILLAPFSIDIPSSSRDIARAVLPEETPGLGPPVGEVVISVKGALTQHLLPVSQSKFPNADSNQGSGQREEKHPASQLGVNPLFLEEQEVLKSGVGVGVLVGVAEGMGIEEVGIAVTVGMVGFGVVHISKAGSQDAGPGVVDAAGGDVGAEQTAICVHTSLVVGAGVEVGVEGIGVGVRQELPDVSHPCV